MPFGKISALRAVFRFSPDPGNFDCWREKRRRFGGVWVELGRSFAGGRDCGCDGVGLVAAERPEFNPFVVDGEDREMGQVRKQKWSSAHTTAFSHLAASATFALLGGTYTPDNFPVSVCAYQVTNILPCRWTSTKSRQRSRWEAMFTTACGAAGPRKAFPIHIIYHRVVY